MQKPVIMIIDDEIQVLNAVERDLRKYYNKDYRIVKAISGAQALDAARQLKTRNTPIALFLTDQRMPNMSGTDFLTEAARMFPDSRKVLLTAYADTEAAITSINSLGLDFYLMKPWDPPEEKLYPVLDDLLSDWVAAAPVSDDVIRVAGTLWSANSHYVKDFLARNQIPYQWIDLEADESTRALLESMRSGMEHLPVIFFPNGDTLVEPDTRILAERLGLQTRARKPFYDLIIVGAGPAGLAAAVYGASEGLHTLLVEKDATGGQAGTSSRIENYLGFPKGLSGGDLARRATAQARRLGAEILTAQEVTQVRTEAPYHFVTLADGTELSCHALLVTTGLALSELDVPGVKELTGAGVYYGAAVTEAVHYKGKDVCIVGGGNSAGQGAMFFSRYANKVTLLVRGDSLEKSMSQYLIDQIRGQKNIEARLQCDVTAAWGQQKLEEVQVLENSTGEMHKLPAAALFVFIGAKAHSNLLRGLTLRDRGGFVVTGPDLPRNRNKAGGWCLKRDPYLLETNVPGIFAAGDVRHGSVKRVASAVGEGSIAISFIHQYLKSV
jgi:thioredoxin reductase (NADPH)